MPDDYLAKLGVTKRDLDMRRWDKWRRAIANGDIGSWPRDEFEALLDIHDEEITRLRRQNEELREALKPYGDVSNPEADEDFDDSTRVEIKFGRTTNYGVTLGDLRHASAVLASQEATGADEIPDRQS
jgi:hypothetical protein